MLRKLMNILTGRNPDALMYVDVAPAALVGEPSYVIEGRKKAIQALSDRWILHESRRAARKIPDTEAPAFLKLRAPPTAMENMRKLRKLRVA